MEKKLVKTVSRMRERHNSELIRRMRSGDELCKFDSYASWYPPRPVIEKDPQAIRRLYGDKTSKKWKKVDKGGVAIVPDKSA